MSSQSPPPSYASLAPTGEERSENAPPYEPAVIADGDNDIAKTLTLRPMRVGMPGRIMFNTMTSEVAVQGYEGKGKGKERARDVDEYKNFPPGWLSAAAASQKSTQRYLEVGFVNPSEFEEEQEEESYEDDDDGDYEENSKKFELSGQSSSSSKIPVRDHSARKVYAPMTDFIPVQFDFFVESDGRLERGLDDDIKMNGIFFFAEYWTGISEGLGIEQRESLLMDRIKFHAAANKTTYSGRSMDELQTILTELIDHTEEWKATSDESHLEKFTATLERAAPDVKFGKYAPFESIKAFYGYETVTENIAMQMMSDFQSKQAANESLERIDTWVIRDTHRLLVDSGRLENVPYDNLTFLLRMCVLHIWEPQIEDEDAQIEKLDRALGVVHQLNDREREQQLTRPPGLWDRTKPGQITEMMDLVSRIQSSSSRGK